MLKSNWDNVCRAAIALYMLLASHYISADEFREVYVDIPTQPLIQAVIEFALQADVTIIAQESHLNGYLATPIVGSYYIGSALSLIIARAPVTLSYSVDRDTFLILPINQPEPIQPVFQPAVAQAISEEVIVVGKSIPNRYPLLINSLDRNGISHFDSSRFHNVAGKNFIGDLEPESLIDLLEYSSGATKAHGLGGTNDDYHIRGYRRKSLYMDGFRLSDRTAMQLTPALLDKVEVLKGPSMLFYGQSGAGGVVNVIRSATSSDDSAAVNTTVGGSDYAETVVDINSTSLLKASVPIRLVGVHEYRGANDLYNQQIRKDIMATAELKSHDKFTSLLSYHRQDYKHDNAGGRFAISPSGGFLVLSDEELFSPSGNSSFESSTGLLNASLHYFPSQKWRLSGNYLWQEEQRLGLRTDENLLLDRDVLLSRPFDEARISIHHIANRLAASAIRTSCDGAPCDVIPEITLLEDQAEHETDISINVSLAGSFDYLGFEHRTILGVDLYHQDLYQLFTLNQYRVAEPLDWTISDNSPEASLYNIWLAREENNVSSSVQLKEYRVLRDDYGLYAQLHTRWNSAWMSSLGWRLSKFIGEQRNITDDVLGLVGNVSDISPQFGLVFQPTDQLSIFSNYSESIAIQYLFDDVRSFSKDPEVAQQWEVGIKKLDLGGSLVWSAAFFNIKKYNVYDLEVEGGARILRGPFQHNVTGLEFDASYDSDKNWRVLSHLTLLSNRIVGVDQGITVPHVSDISWSIFNHWTLPNKWEATLGVYGVSDRSLDSLEMSKLDAYQSVDASLSYAVAIGEYDLDIKLIVKNLFDDAFFRAADLGGYADKVSGRSAYIKLGIEI